MYLSELQNLSKFGELNNITFECKVNILKIVMKNIYNNPTIDDPLYFYKSDNIKNEFKFEWTLNDTFIIDEIINCDYKTFKKSKPFHSDILCDMFQFVIQGHIDQYLLMGIQLIGLPINTNKMIIKLELYCKEIMGQQIMSNILTLNYENKPIYYINKDQSKLLMDIINFKSKYY